jgi:hypothetical protein
MASLTDGLILCEHITTVLNTLITTKGKQLDKNEKAIWDDFLHQLTNDEWESMFMAFKHLVDKHRILLTDHQQRKFDEAYMTFQKDKHKRERCMDIRNKFMNTKNLAWSMIMIIREIHNLTTNTDVPNVDKPKQPEIAPPQPGKKRKINIHATIEIWEDLFDSE